MSFLGFLSFVIFIISFGFIVSEKIPRMNIAILGAVLVIAIGVFDIQEAFSVVNWETIGFLLGVFILIEILVEAGFFRWVALAVAKKLQYNPLKILIFFPLLAAMLSAFVDSITVMLFLTTVTIELSRYLKFDPVPVIVSEVVLANIGGAATVVGDPPNVILGTVLGFNFGDFVIHNAPISILCALTAIGIIYFIHRKQYSCDVGLCDVKELKDMEPRSVITDKYLLRLGLVGLYGMLLFLVAKPVFDVFGIKIHVAMSSLIPAFMILSFGGERVYKHKFVRRIDAETIMFFIGLFILIGALEKTKVIHEAVIFLMSVFNTSATFISVTYWWSALLSAFTDNVPLAMAMTYVIKQSVVAKIVPNMGIMVWATSMGVDMGGNLTPIGASANVVAYSTMEKNKLSIGWKRWIVLAFPPGIAALIVGYLCIMLKWHLKFF
jgi:Na+/H+ antiporter NhaD/arsenite permease-like protein